MLLCFGNKFQERLVLIHRRKYLVEYFDRLAELLLGEGLVDLLAGGGELEELLLVAVVLVVRVAVVLALSQPIPALARGLDVNSEGMFTLHLQTLQNNSSSSSNLHISILHSGVNVEVALVVFLTDMSPDQTLLDVKTLLIQHLDPHMDSWKEMNCTALTQTDPEAS